VRIDHLLQAALALLIDRLLAEADALYLRAEAGVAVLPLDCRPGIFGARHIYAGIGQAVRRNACDSVTRRARTGKAAKIGWLALALGRTAASVALPRSPHLHARPAPEVAFLVTAAARQSAAPGRTDALLAVLAQLKAQDAQRRTQGGAALSRGLI
jgi:phytoene synthase